MRIPCQEEKIQAILDARQDLAEYLQSIGKLHAFEGFTKDEICGLIKAAQMGVQKSLRRQVQEAFEMAEIPF